MSVSSDTGQSQFVGYETEMRVQFSLLAFRLVGSNGMVIE